MKQKTTLVLGIGAVIAGVIMGMMAVMQRQPEKVLVVVAPASQPAAAPASEMSPSAPPVEIQAAETGWPAPAVVEISPPPKIQMPAASGGLAQKSKRQLQDPAARMALSLVGADSGAEQYWLAAIFDPALPDQEREDLMEDLNEDGLSNPEHPGLEDLPLIVNRLQIIEEIAPYADEFMLTHLGEAFKDLHLLLAGQPVP
jgi:hypothetical protein